MSSLMWILLIAMLAMLVLSLFWFIVKMRSFSQSQSQTVLDDRLMQAILADAALSKKVKKALVKQTAEEVADKEEENRPLASTRKRPVDS